MLIKKPSVAALVHDDPSWLPSVPEQLQFCESTVADLSKSVARRQAAVGAVRVCFVDRLSPSMYALAKVGLKALLRGVDDTGKGV